MTNIIINLQERNKELSDKISNLEKQLTDKEENFKIRTWNAVHGLTENVEEYTGVTLKTLERFTWPENGWIGYPEKNGLEIGRVVSAMDSLLKILLKVLVRKPKIMKKLLVLPTKKIKN